MSVGIYGVDADGDPIPYYERKIPAVLWRLDIEALDDTILFVKDFESDAEAKLFYERLSLAVISDNLRGPSGPPGVTGAQGARGPQGESA